MIVYDLRCDAGHGFEGWFSSSSDYDSQQDKGILSCPQCGSQVVEKAPMAPAVGRKGNQVLPSAPVEGGQTPQEPQPQQSSEAIDGVMRGELPAEVVTALSKLADAQSKALKQSRWVGDEFADRSRAIHYGESDAENIHGRATPEQARELLEEGVDFSPLPFPVTPPDELN
ncbi:DUF1178 family protein [Altericroceibacterium endophyticum]|uniref:DUF1178 family protein n=1 Tax=Altericroceibacterium endophyticum TaxID=1808508 RepID=A0A6I4T524_9SPHN|nr:DUF1178 family protein [Altericroceibacterium endophyticum]MXO65967.1 DUF1178 family protein [Altericroceibacterium endophyticum]